VTTHRGVVLEGSAEKLTKTKKNNPEIPKRFPDFGSVSKNCNIE